MDRPKRPVLFVPRVRDDCDLDGDDHDPSLFGNPDGGRETVVNEGALAEQTAEDGENGEDEPAGSKKPCKG